jgi:hypothetical protein
MYAKPLTVVQNCYVVRDLELACRRMNRLYGLGPFVGGARSELGHHIHRGNPAPPIVLRSVFAQSGDLNVELVQLESQTPNAFLDVYPQGGDGFHHIAVFCDDYAGERDRLVSEGFEVASEFTLSFGVSICYLDARASLGHMIELCPEHEIIRDRYRQAREAAKAWDREELFLPWR